MAMIAGLAERCEACLRHGAWVGTEEYYGDALSQLAADHHALLAATQARLREAEELIRQADDYVLPDTELSPWEHSFHGRIMSFLARAKKESP